MSRLAGKVAVITGAGGALGSAMATAFAREGANVVCQDLREQAAASTAAQIGPTARPYACDVTDSKQIGLMLDRAGAEFGYPVDVLVNNAGVERVSGDGAPEHAGLDQLTHMADDAWRAMLDVHVTGSFICTREVIRRLRAGEQPGSIICISSIVPLTGHGPIHYAAAKAALIGFVRSIAAAGGRHGIRANAIAPGMIRTPMSDAVPEAQEFVRRRTPLGRIGEAEDVAPLAVYLASDESAFLTGQTISPNGGIVAL